MADHITYLCKSMRYMTGVGNITAGGVVDPASTSISIPGATCGGANRLIVAISTGAIDSASFQGSSSWTNDDTDVTGEAFFGWNNATTGVGGGITCGSGQLAGAGSSGTFSSTWASATKQANVSLEFLGTQTPETYDETKGSGTDNVAVTEPIYGGGFYLVLIVQSANEPIATPTGWTKVFEIGTGTAGAAGSTRVTIFTADADDSPTMPTLTYAATGYTIDAESGSVPLTGTDASLRTSNVVMSAETVNVPITGTDASLRGPMEVGDHGIYQVNFGSAPASGTIELQTQVSGSTFVMIMGGNMNDIGDGPTDSESNTWRQISTSWQFADAENAQWGVAAWRAINGTGDATSHIFTQNITVFDELTMFAVELKGAHYLLAQDRQEEANASTPGTVGPTTSVTIDVPAILLASWWGSGAVGQDHTATPDGSGWVQLQFFGTNNNNGYVQAGLWAKVVSAGTHSVTFTHSPAQGSKNWLMAFGLMPKVTADPASVPLTGADTSLEFNRIMSGESGGVSLVGTEVNLNKGTTLTAEVGNVPLTGTDTSLEFGYRIDAETGELSIVGIDTTLVYGHPMVGESAPIAVTGTDADLEAARYLSAEAAAVPLAGTDASPTHGFRGDAEAGAVPVAGTDVDLRAARLLSAETTAVSLTGTDASPRADRPLVADPASLDITGIDASLTHGFRLDAEAASVPLTGTDTILIVSRYMPADTVNVPITGVDANLNYDQSIGYEINAETGNLALTAADASLLATRYVLAEEASLSVAGTDADVRATRRVTAEAAGVDLIAPGAALLAHRHIDADSAAVAITGGDVDLHYGYRMEAEAALLVLTGVAASLLTARRVSAESGAVSISSPAETHLFWSGEVVLAVAWAYTVRATIEDLAAQGGFAGSLDDMTSTSSPDDVLEDLGGQSFGTLEDN